MNSLNLDNKTDENNFLSDSYKSSNLDKYNVVPIKQSDKLFQEGIVTSFVVNKEINSIVLELNHKYDRIIIPITINQKNWSEFIETCKKEFKRKEITNEHIKLIVDTLDNNYTKILGINEQIDNDDNIKENKIDFFNDWKNQQGQQHKQSEAKEGQESIAHCKRDTNKILDKNTKLGDVSSSMTTSSETTSKNNNSDNPVFDFDEEYKQQAFREVFGTEMPNFGNGKSKKKKTKLLLEQQRPQQEKTTIEAANPEILFTEWSKTLTEKYSALQKEIKNLIPELWEPVEFALSIRSILKIHSITLPFAGIILGPPSSLKTVTIELFRKTNQTYYTDNFSAKAFVTHNTAIPKEKLPEIDLLPKIKNKVFLTPELSPTFSKKDDELNEILGIITRVLDGHGYESDTGAQGHRGYNGDYMFVWIGAAVDIPRKVYKLLGTLGPKLYFFRLKTEEKSEDYFLHQLEDEDKNGDFRKKIDQIHIKLSEYLEYFDLENVKKKEEGEQEQEETKHSDKNNQKRDTLRYIIRLAHLLRRLRGNVPVWDTPGTQGSDYAYTFPTVEDPNRAITQLRNLARGHALSQGRDYITVDDIPILIKLVLSTASKERVIIFDHLLENKGLLDSITIADHLLVSKNTALKTMTELVVLGLVNRISLHSKNDNAFQIQLYSEFDWFLSDQFKKLRQDFGKEYYNVYLAGKERELENKEPAEEAVEGGHTN